MKRTKKQNRMILAGFLNAVIAVGALLFLTNQKKNVISPVESLSLSDLPTAFEDGGIETYRERKERLRRDIHDRLAKGATAEDNATQIAVYLFPDLLDKNNFEKEAASLWVPLQEQIEREPKRPSSRRAFEELRATIWNYESPSGRGTPSRVAQQVIKLYDVMSAP